MPLTWVGLTNPARLSPGTRLRESAAASPVLWSPTTTHMPCESASLASLTTVETCTGGRERGRGKEGEGEIECEGEESEWVS